MKGNPEKGLIFTQNFYAYLIRNALQSFRSLCHIFITYKIVAKYQLNNEILIPSEVIWLTKVTSENKNAIVSSSCLKMKLHGVNSNNKNTDRGLHKVFTYKSLVYSLPVDIIKLVQRCTQH